MFYFLYKTGFEFIALENVAVLHSPSEKTKASYQTKARMGKVSLSAHNKFCVHCPQRMSLRSILRVRKPKLPTKPKREWAMFHFLLTTGFVFIALRECRFAPFSKLPVFAP